MSLTILEKKAFATALKGRRVHLEKSNPTYTNQVWDYIQRDRECGGKIYSWIESLEDVAKYITTEPNPNADEIDYLILVGEKAVGSFHVHSRSYAHHKAEIGYAIEKSQEGRGLVSESLELVLKEMKTLGFNKVIINCDKDNLRSIQVAEKNGFHREGLLIQDCLENGRFRDSVIYGKLLK